MAACEANINKEGALIRFVNVIVSFMLLTKH